MNLDRAIYQAESGECLSFHAAQVLYAQADLLTLGRLAHTARFRHNPEPVVTYAVDRNINYTNVCVSGCLFCAFWRPPKHVHSYVLDRLTLAQKLEETKKLGGTHILLQGGLNPDLDLEWHEDVIRFIRSFGLNVHGYSPPEVYFFAERSGLETGVVLRRLINAGLSSMPGGGAEILVDRVRRKISPGKTVSREWLDIMATAHALGLKTTATMMFGHVETDAERLIHLFRLRRLQARTGGFTSFILWPYQPSPRTIQAKRLEGAAYLRMVALARLVLDNFMHVQASWVTQGPDTGQVALFFGADDLGSTMIEENVVAAAGVGHRLSEAEMVRLIETAGFVARQRDNCHRPVGSKE